MTSQVVFYHDDAVTMFDEHLERIQQFAYVVKMQTGGWFVKYENVIPSASFSQKACQFDRWASPPLRGGSCFVPAVHNPDLHP